jgi:hypothetical protein
MTFLTSLAATLAAYWTTTTGGRKTRKALTTELDLAHQRLEALERITIAIVHLLVDVERETRGAASVAQLHTRAILALSEALPDRMDGDLEEYRDALALRLEAAKKNGAGHDHP